MKMTLWEDKNLPIKNSLKFEIKFILKYFWLK